MLELLFSCKLLPFHKDHAGELHWCVFSWLGVAYSESKGSPPSMVWDLVATAAAGLNAGAGLQAAMAGTPSASDSAVFSRFTSRTRATTLFLSIISSSACLAAYLSEDRGGLWAVAAAGVGIGIPYNLLLMAPPTAVLAPARLEPSPPSPPPRGHLSPQGCYLAPAAQEEDHEAGAGTPGVTSAEQESAFAETASNYSEEPTWGRPGPLPLAARRLMYAKSGEG